MVHPQARPICFAEVRPIRSDVMSPHLRRVLIVDDDADSRDLYAQVLGQKGHTVVTAEDGEKAITLILGGGFEVVMLDVTLPGIDGVEVARRTRAGLGASAPRLVAMSGYAPMSRDKRELPFDAYLVKPVEMEAVLAQVAAGRVASAE